MNVNTATNHLYVSQHNQPSMDKSDSTQFSTAMDAATQKKPSEDAVVKKVDFTDMTRQEMWDWMNGQITSGEMSLDGTEILAGMYTLPNIGDDQTGLASRVQSERINFFDAVQNGIDFYSARGDYEAVQSWQQTLNILQQAQGQLTHFDEKV